MQELCNMPFYEGLETQLGEHLVRLLALNGGDCTLDLLTRDEIRLHDHRRPEPLRLVSRSEASRVVCPPETLEGHDRIVDPLRSALERKLQRERRSVQCCDRVRIER